MKILYFTSTGNCLEVAKKIGGDLISIPSALKGNKFDFEDEIIGIIAPVYKGGLPSPVTEFLQKAKLKANYIFGIMTYGASGFTANGILFQTGLQNNIRFNYINSMIMVDNSFVYFDMEKQIKNLPKKKVDASINKIKADIENRVKKIHSSIIGRKMAGIVMRRQKNSKPNFAENFFIEDFCIKCGICEKVCPIDNITIKNKVVIHDDCIRCGACYHNCPKGAIRYKGEKK